MGRILKYHKGKTGARVAVHENVSDEEKAITPWFRTKEELIEHLVKEGTTWDGPWTREQAEKFVNETEYAPSFALIPRTGFVKGYEM